MDFGYEINVVFALVLLLNLLLICLLVCLVSATLGVPFKKKRLSRTAFGWFQKRKRTVFHMFDNQSQTDFVTFQVCFVVFYLYMGLNLTVFRFRREQKTEIKTATNKF